MADFEAAKIVHENHLLLDQPLLRLPYELLRKNFRSAHWIVEKESTQVKTLLKDTATGSLNGKSSPEDVLKNLDTMLSRMRGLKRKLSTCADEEARLYRQVDARVAHLSELSEMHTVDDVRYQEWSRQRLDRLLVDYLLRHGYSASAVAMADKKGMRDLVDIETFMAANKIRKSLEDGSVTEALAWCNENKKELRKMDSNLEFMLRYQQYIELVRSQTTDKLVEAITHAKKYLIPYKDTYPREVHQAAGLLAFPPDRIASLSSTNGSSSSSSPS
ncbi:Protein FYV10, partial [Coniochaeta hoffmannii]